MSLRTKTLLFMSAGLVSLISLLSAALLVTLARGFDAVERRAMGHNLQSVREAVLDEMNKLAFTADEWGGWDDSYQFVADRNQAFVASNLADGSIRRLDMNVIAYVDQDGQIVFGRGLAPDGTTVVDIPDSLRPHLQPGSPLLTPGESRRGDSQA